MNRLQHNFKSTTVRINRTTISHCAVVPKAGGVLHIGDTKVDTENVLKLICQARQHRSRPQQILYVGGGEGGGGVGGVFVMFVSVFSAEN